MTKDKDLRTEPEDSPSYEASLSAEAEAHLRKRLAEAEDALLPVNEAHQQGYMAGIAYAEAEAGRLRKRAERAEAELAAIRRHPVSAGNGDDCPPCHKPLTAAYKVLEAIGVEIKKVADEQVVIRRDIGACVRSVIGKMIEAADDDGVCVPSIRTPEDGPVGRRKK